MGEVVKTLVVKTLVVNMSLILSVSCVCAVGWWEVEGGRRKQRGGRVRGGEQDEREREREREKEEERE